MESFTKAYKSLNDEQKQAVDAIDGPVLVIAGPGTGKTQLLSVRVANILDKTDTAPQNILCLTFTNKAATNMRERLFDIIGPTAYNVAVNTFHSFAADIMNHHADDFWNGARLGSVPDAVQLEIIQDILSSLPLSNPLARRFAGELTGIKDAKQALKLTKEAGLTPEKLKTILDVNTAYIDLIEPTVTALLSQTLSFKKLQGLYDNLEAELPNQHIDDKIAPLLSLRTVMLDSLAFAIEQDQPLGKTTNTGKWKKRFLQTVAGQKGMHDERRRNAWWQALAGVYKTYRTILHEKGYYDYADMLVEVISQLEQNDDLRATVQEQYTYVLIDEFQDTNPAQLRLAHLVADHHAANGKPNLMVVGDDDQSIFKFNGAELNNMLGFRSFYGVNKPIVLTQNYRSSQTVLDVARQIAAQAEDRLVYREADIIKDLTAVNEPKQKGTIAHTIYPTKQHQHSAVAREVAKAFQPNTSVAVLARNHQSLRDMAALLHNLNVPVKYEQQNDILQHPAVSQIIHITQLLDALSKGNEPFSNELLSKVLRHPMWGISPVVLWELAIENRYKPHWMRTLLNHSDKSLQLLGQNLLSLAQNATQEPLPLVLEYILGLRPFNDFTSPFKAYYITDKTITQQYVETLSAIQLLRTLVNDFARSNVPTVEQFVRFVEVLQDSDDTITDETRFVAGTHAVELLTVHKAKGLEFDTVFVIDVNESNWKPSTTGRKPPANLPLQAYGDNQDDYVRLFYVAATRAKHSLFVSSFATDDSGKELLAASFVRAALPSRELTVQESGDVITVLQEASTWPTLTNTEEKLLFSPLVEDFSLSVTALINFLDIDSGGPAYFKERNILRLPEAKSISQSYGTAIHTALDRAQLLTNQDAYDIDEVVAAFEDALEAEYVPAQDFERYLAKGQEILWTLLHTYGYKLTKGSLPEQSVSVTLSTGAKLGGKLDRIDTQGKPSLLIADYKTGKPLQSFATKDQHKAIKAWKHKTQLIYYALLAKNDMRFADYTDTECQMVYVEADDPKNLVRSYSPTTDEIERMAQLASKVSQHIKGCNFPDVSHYPSGIAGITQFEDDLLNSN